MKLYHLLTVTLGVTIILGAAMFGYAQLTPESVHAAPAWQAEPTERTITVVGEGRILVDPDIAQVTLGVESYASDVQTAANETETIMTNLMTTLTAQGVAEKDIQTSNYSVHTERYGGPMEVDSEANYRFSNNVTIVVRDLETVEAVLGAAIEAGANSIYGVSFNVAEPAELRKQARAEAVSVAQAKAQELADLNGVTVGQVVSISELVNNAGPYANSFTLHASEGLGGGGPISPGELQLTVQLQITYAIQ